MSSCSRSIWLITNRSRRRLQQVVAQEMELCPSVAQMSGGTGDLSASRVGQDKKMAG